MPKKSSISRDEAEVIALKALGFLASDPDRITRFLRLTGTTPESIRDGAIAPRFLSGVLEYLCGDQTLLLLFTESEGLKPEIIDSAIRSLADA